ncbi:MAG: heme-binding protein [Vicinamibacterales bacterium]
MSHTPLGQKHVLHLTHATELLAAAARTIAERGWAMYVAFVDDAGTPLLVAAVADPQPASYEIAVAKAQCAARFRRPTRIWEERVKSGAPNVMSLPGVVASEGGVPLVFANRVIGAVGVSGGTGAEDGVVAEAVIARAAGLLQVDDQS